MQPANFQPFSSQCAQEPAVALAQLAQRPGRSSLSKAGGRPPLAGPARPPAKLHWERSRPEPNTAALQLCSKAMKHSAAFHAKRQQVHRSPNSLTTASTSDLRPPTALLPHLQQQQQQQQQPRCTPPSSCSLRRRSSSPGRPASSRTATRPRRRPSRPAHTAVSPATVYPPGLAARSSDADVARCRQTGARAAASARRTRAWTSRVTTAAVS